MPIPNDEDSLRLELPWLVNGSLSAQDREAMLATLKDQPALEAEHRFLERLRQAVRGEEDTGPGELGWRRLQRSIQQERQSGWNNWWKGAAIAASVALAAQSGFVWWDAERPGGFEPMTEPLAQVAPQIQMRLRPDASAADIQALLNALDLRIVDGPSASGVYRLTGPAGSIDASLQRLRASTALVEYAERE
jgi:hypothetical protein